MTALLSSFLFLSGIQGIFLSIIILKRNRNNGHEQYFSVIMISLFSINIILGEIIGFFAVNQPDFLVTYSAIQLLTGPVFYYYCRNVTKKDFKHKITDIFRFLPFMIYILFLIIVHISSEFLLYLSIANKILWLVIILQLLYYLLVIKRIINDYKKTLANNYSSYEKFSIDWLNYIFISIIMLLSIYFVLLPLILHNINNEITMKIYSLILSFLIYFFGYRSMTQKKIELVETVNNQKYQKSGLTKDLSVFWKNKIISVLESNEYYLDPELTLSGLSGYIGLSENNLSQIINSEINTTFYELINNYRLEKVKKILSYDEEKNILEAAYDAGFNSKTTFNTYFKKKTGLTPSQYKNSLKNIKK